ncbi:MAG: DUF4340 domain-containing protein [Bacteroidales bacterium]|nr:DUF4340 domain-containing protein [Bacteroidales bacterium]
MKKNLIYLIVAGVLILASLFAVLFRQGVFSHDSDYQKLSEVFAIKDTNNITKIFIADMQGAHLLVTRNPANWVLEDGTKVTEYYINSVLAKLHNITVRQTVAKSAIENITKRIAAGGTKVEVYQMLPKFTIFGVPFFVKERLSKTYYLGPETQDNMGNYALLEGMNEPYIVHIPGFRGYITAQFSPDAKNWETHDIFTTKITRIAEVSFKDLDNPQESFTVKKAGSRFFNVLDANNQQLMSYDTTKLLDMLSEFRDLNYDVLVSTIREGEKDTVLSSKLFRIIILTDTEGKKTELKMYRMMDDENLQVSEDYNQNLVYAFDKDHCFGVMNGNAQKLAYLQYAHFDRQIQPLSYFRHR